jgi:hypothetical protein
MRCAIILLLMLAAGLPLPGSPPIRAPRDPDHIRIYELALRHFLTVLRPPDDATVWVAIGSRPAPPELIERFRGSKPVIHAWEDDVSIPHECYCGMYVGSDAPDKCLLVVSGPPDNVLHHYHFEKQQRDWQLLKDEIAYLE